MANILLCEILYSALVETVHGNCMYIYFLHCVLMFVLQPGCVNTTEVDIKKACRMNRHSKMSRVSITIQWIFFSGSNPDGSFTVPD